MEACEEVNNALRRLTEAMVCVAFLHSCFYMDKGGKTKDPMNDTPAYKLVFAICLQFRHVLLCSLSI